MKPSVYLETSFISYQASRLSNDLIVAGHQRTTQLWWEKRRSDFNLFVSQFVLDEAALGDKEAANKRLEVLRTIPLLDIKPEVALLAKNLVAKIPLPKKATQDAAHVAVAAVNGIDYLLTWNCRHIANVFIRRKIQEVCAKSGFKCPGICTPDALLGNYAETGDL